jgi:hypothetical protein
VQHQDELASERATTKARLADLLQHESVLEASQAGVRERMERKTPTFARAIHNMATAAAHLDALLTPFTDGMGEV